MVKIADFGLAKAFLRISTPRQGTVKWIAPEVFEHKQYTPKADVYSFGLIFWEVFMQKPIYSTAKFDFEVEKRVRSGERPEIPSEFYVPFAELINSCWMTNPEQRPTMAQVVSVLNQAHPIEKIEL